jgi:hypothetical protein
MLVSKVLFIIESFKSITQAIIPFNWLILAEIKSYFFAVSLINFKSVIWINESIKQPLKARKIENESNYKKLKWIIHYWQQVSNYNLARNYWNLNQE